MTVINGIEIDDIDYKRNDTVYAIRNNAPIEEKLNVVVVISNPCLYAKRYILLKEFVSRMEHDESENVELFVVELVYGNQKFIVTDKSNDHHLQLRTETPLWHKENMINLAVEKLLVPRNYKAFAWVDADIEFESASWAMDTLKILNGSKDVVQLFSHCVDMDKDESTMNVFSGFGYNFSKNKKFVSPTCKNRLDFWHPGFAWAITRRAFDKLGGLFDCGILGSGDHIMALSIIKKANRGCINAEYDRDYNMSILDFEKKATGLRLGYTPGVVRHFYHGTKQNRQYSERWKILAKHKYSPARDVCFDAKTGLLQPTRSFPEALKYDIMKYFSERKEDE